MAEPVSNVTKVRLSEARTHLEELGERAVSGGGIVVTEQDKPLFKIIALESRQR